MNKKSTVQSDNVVEMVIEESKIVFIIIIIIFVYFHFYFIFFLDNKNDNNNNNEESVDDLLKKWCHNKTQIMKWRTALEDVDIDDMNVLKELAGGDYWEDTIKPLPGVLKTKLSIWYKQHYANKGNLFISIFYK